MHSIKTLNITYSCWYTDTKIELSIWIPIMKQSIIFVCIITKKSFFPLFIWTYYVWTHGGLNAFKLKEEEKLLIFNYGNKTVIKCNESLVLYCVCIYYNLLCIPRHMIFIQLMLSLSFMPTYLKRYLLIYVNDLSFSNLYYV